MADTPRPDAVPDQPDYDLADGASDYALRAEMGVQEFLLRYWQLLIGAVAAVFVGFLVYGWWGSAAIASQRAATARIADVEAGLPSGLLQLAQARAGVGTPPEADDIIDEAEALMAVGDESTGTAAVEAWLKAAELYRLADQPEPRRAALDKAAGASSGVLAYAARSALANLDLESGQVDEGLARFEALTSLEPEFLARRATLDLAAAQEAVGRNDAARATYDRFLSTWPTAPEAEQASDLKARVGQGIAVPEPSGDGEVEPEPEPEPEPERAPEPSPEADGSAE